MKFTIPALSVLLLFLYSCHNSDDKARSLKNAEAKIPTETYRVNIDSLLGDFQKWYNYTYYNIRLEQDFIGLDSNSNKIGKRQFLDQLASGEVIACKTAKEGSTPVYKLYKASTLSNDIRSTSTGMANTALRLLKMEGTQLPAYNFTDLQGKRYNPASTKGKLLLVKCWFIHCFKCIEEFPVLNGLVDRYKNRTDITFISLASDSKKDLSAFLVKKPFHYAVVPCMKEYMANKLAVNAYPLHLLINREGNIVKATNSIEDLVPSLESEINK